VTKPVTNPTMLLETNEHFALGDVFDEVMHYHNVTHAYASWVAELKFTVVDLVTIEQLIDTYGVSYRGASMVREYLDNRD